MSLCPEMRGEQYPARRWARLEGASFPCHHCHDNEVLPHPIVFCIISDCSLYIRASHNAKLCFIFAIFFHIYIFFLFLKIFFFCQYLSHIKHIFLPSEIIRIKIKLTILQTTIRITHFPQHNIILSLKREVTLTQ